MKRRTATYAELRFINRNPIVYSTSYFNGVDIAVFTAGVNRHLLGSRTRQSRSMCLISNELKEKQVRMCHGPETVAYTASQWHHTRSAGYRGQPVDAILHMQHRAALASRTCCRCSHCRNLCSEGGQSCCLIWMKWMDGWILNKRQWGKVKVIFM